MFKNTKRRQKLFFGFREVVRNVFCSMKVFSKCRKRKFSLKLQQKMDQYQDKGKEKLLRELDCVTILRKLRLVENLASLLFTIP